MIAMNIDVVQFEVGCFVLESIDKHRVFSVFHPLSALGMSVVV